MDYLRQDGYEQSQIDKSVEEYFINWFQDYVSKILTIILMFKSLFLIWILTDFY